ncbi:MAG: hypothetical protein L0228_19040 [Planctomycetes bacterium]|nr:hypothetical protein [Planctomycetota bacterium]
MSDRSLAADRRWLLPIRIPGGQSDERSSYIAAVSPLPVPKIHTDVRARETAVSDRSEVLRLRSRACGRIGRGLQRGEANQPKRAKYDKYP